MRDYDTEILLQSDQVYATEIYSSMGRMSILLNFKIIRPPVLLTASTSTFL
ncbi:hypothetical protein DPMN_056292 [Dreissena polymorpha]|uniref:Uncharacterized protein n=1 Tax=Dreissena polymorpha TaxID=45954 RepID=A0A9D4CRE9_DREPO|nr:hypothetical protein DPMN_056292 [Dreissena polymorpha]